MLTADQLRRIMPKCNAEAWAAPLAMAMDERDILTPARVAAFLAQLAHESVELTRLEENLTYSSPERLMQVWPKRFPTADSAKPYVKSPEKLANFVYANRNGNNDEASGDGWRFRGRGPIQLTGRRNYRDAGFALNIELETHPEAVLSPTVGARVAAWYWSQRNLNAQADAGNITAITKAINGGTHGLAERVAYTAKALKILGGV